MTQQPQALNPQYETIGKEFVQAYYARFDQKAMRPQIAEFYTPNQSFLSFEGQQFMGKQPITEKLVENFPMGNIQRAITKIDCQPMFDGGILVFVLGQLQGDSEGDKALGFSQVFVLKSDGSSWYILHDIFRLAVHDFGS